MGGPTRGFFGRRRTQPDPRLPPGQYDTGDAWPVLTAEVTPALSTDTWTFSVDGLVERPTIWTWDEIQALPSSTYEGPIHCVTTWSKFGTHFAGVSVDTLLALAGPTPEATFVMARSHTGYTTNLPLADVTDGKAWVVWEYEGAPLPSITADRLGCSSRTCTSGRAPSGCPASSYGRGPTRVLGAERVPRSWRPLARAALPG